MTDGRESEARLPKTGLRKEQQRCVLKNYGN